MTGAAFAWGFFAILAGVQVEAGREVLAVIFAGVSFVALLVALLEDKK